MYTEAIAGRRDVLNWWYLAAVKVVVLLLAASHFTGLLTRLEAAATEDD